MGRRVRRPCGNRYERRGALKAPSAVKWPGTGRRGVVAGITGHGRPACVRSVDTTGIRSLKFSIAGAPLETP